MKKLLFALTIALLNLPLIQTMQQTAGSSAAATSDIHTYNQEATAGILKLIQSRKGGAGLAAGEDIDIDALKKLLKAGANPNAKIGEKNYSLLHWAASVMVPTLDFYKTMIEAGADPLATDYKGRTPLQFLRSGAIFRTLKAQIKKYPAQAEILQGTLDKLEAVAKFLKEAETAAKKENEQALLAPVDLNAPLTAITESEEEGAE